VYVDYSNLVTDVIRVHSMYQECRCIMPHGMNSISESSLPFTLESGRYSVDTIYDYGLDKIHRLTLCTNYNNSVSKQQDRRTERAA